MEPQQNKSSTNYTFNMNGAVPNFDYVKYIQSVAGQNHLTVVNSGHNVSHTKIKKHYPNVQKQILGALDEGIEITSAKIEDDTLYVQIKGPDSQVYNIQIDIYEDNK